MSSAYDEILKISDIASFINKNDIFKLSHGSFVKDSDRKVVVTKVGQTALARDAVGSMKLKISGIDDLINLAYIKKNWDDSYKLNGNDIIEIFGDRGFSSQEPIDVDELQIYGFLLTKLQDQNHEGLDKTDAIKLLRGIYNHHSQNYCGLIEELFLLKLQHEDMDFSQKINTEKSATMFIENGKVHMRVTSVFTLKTEVQDADPAELKELVHPFDAVETEYVL